MQSSSFFDTIKEVVTNIYEMITLYIIKDCLFKLFQPLFEQFSIF